MREKIDFSGQTAVVTGAASGIGREVATEFATEGADVAILDIDEDRGQAATDDISDDHGVDAGFYDTDVSDYDDVGDSVSAIVDDLGGIDVLANVAAGGLQDDAEPFIEEGPEDWAPHIEVSYRGVLHTCHHVLQHMTDRGEGAIVNVASDSYMGQDPNLAVYAGSKAGIVSFTKTVAKEVGEDGVRVNAISPSTTWTPATEDWLEEYGDKIAESYPLGRLGQPADHANAIVFLASDAADWVTGQVLSVNGGFL
jgi:NAD(P)-dependent dehydrogenase (short-subunit alcohol dehydrogenase family)